MLDRCPYFLMLGRGIRQGFELHELPSLHRDRITTECNVVKAQEMRIKLSINFDLFKVRKATVKSQGGQIEDTLTSSLHSHDNNQNFAFM